MTALPAVRSPGAPVAPRLLATLTAHHTAAFFRAPVAAFFTLVFPVMFVLIIGAVAGAAVIDQRSGVRVAQFVTPAFAVFGVVQACFTSMAIRAAILRDKGIDRRMKGTPVPPLLAAGGQIGAGVLVSPLAFALVIAVGMAAYDVRLVPEKLPALLVSLLAGIACFTALGLALVALARRPTVVEAVTTGSVVALSFVSDIFIVGAELPRPLDLLGWALPLRHFANAVGDAFNPFLPGDGFAFDHLGVLAAWGVAGLAVAVLVPLRAGGRTGAVPREAEAVPAVPGALPPVRDVRVTAWSLVRGATGHALLNTRRDKATVFFTLFFPVLLVLLFPLIFGGVMGRDRITALIVPGMLTYTAALAGYVNLAEQLVRAKETGVTKRLHGTPQPAWAYLAGRLLMTGAVVAATGTVIALTGALAFGVAPPARHLPALLLAIASGVACFAALGFVVAGLARDSQTAAAVTLGTFLPLSFVSKVFMIGDLPEAMDRIGALTPLRHAAEAALAAYADTPGAGVAAGHLAVVAGWTLAAAAVALPLWRRQRGG